MYKILRSVETSTQCIKFYTVLSRFYALETVKLLGLKLRLCMLARVGVGKYSIVVIIVNSDSRYLVTSDDGDNSCVDKKVGLGRCRNNG